MLKLLFTILFNIAIILPAIAQNIHQLKAFADEQVEMGNYQTALKEYQRIQFFDTDQQYPAVNYNIATIFFNQENYEEAIRYYNFAWTVETNDSLKTELAFRKSFCYIIQEDYYSALNEIFDISTGNSGYFEAKKNLYTGICYFGLNENPEAMAYFSTVLGPQGIEELNRVFNDFNRYKKKFNPEKVELMSSILPGLGQFYTGEVGAGLNSVVLLTGIVIYAFYTTSTYGWIDGALVLSSWFFRYYKGGAQKANMAAVEKINAETTRVYTEILSIVDKHQNDSKK